MDKLTNRINVRGVDYLVTELTGKQMAGVRKLIATERHRVEAWVAFQCCIEPRIPNEDAAYELPVLVIDKISSEAFRLSKLDPVNPESEKAEEASDPTKNV